MSGARTDSGKRLQREWRIPVKQTHYHYQGTFYMPLTEFPAALADRNGYVIFNTEQELRKRPDAKLRSLGTPNPRLGVKDGISTLSAYVRKRRPG